jgi:UDP-glucuronate decarboxylase
MNNDIIFKDAAEILKRVDFTWLEKKTVLITGATGLLGTHFLATLCLLKEAGMKIKVFAACHSEPADYTEEIAHRGRIQLIDGFPGITHTGDDVIIQAAGYAQPRVFTRNPVETIRINTDLTQQLLRKLRPGGKFLFISSSEVYSGLQGVATEDMIGTTTPYHERACYIEGKRCGETIVNAYRLAGLDAKSARLGLTYGPGTRKGDQRAMSSFIRQALTNDVIDMQYSGRDPRVFCYVRDAVEMLWNICLRGKQSVYNVGGSSFTDMRNIALRIGEMTNSEVKLQWADDEIPGSGDVQMSISRVQEEFGYRGFVGMIEGLQNTIGWNRGLY